MPEIMIKNITRYVREHNLVRVSFASSRSCEVRSSRIPGDPAFSGFEFIPPRHKIFLFGFVPDETVGACVTQPWRPSQFGDGYPALGWRSSMPYSREHREKIREKVVRSARLLFNRHGFNGVSIDQIMADAGLTRGGFYGYFKSKTELYAEAVTRVVGEKADQGRSGRSLEPPAAAAQVVRDYLSREHFEDIDGSCPMIALPSDMSHMDPRIREAFETALKLLIDLFEAGLGPGQGTRKTALAISTLCVGGMVLARSIENRALANELREGAMAAALALGQWP
jgi:TetR/AcrR family transcriptional repressor of nem operon